MNRAGFGELISMFTAPADWYLASAIGMDDAYDAAGRRSSTNVRRASSPSPRASRTIGMRPWPSSPGS